MTAHSVIPAPPALALPPLRAIRDMWDLPVRSRQWPREKDLAMLDLFNGGMSATQVAGYMGLQVDTVLARYSRLVLSGDLKRTLRAVQAAVEWGV